MSHGGVLEDGNFMSEPTKTTRAKLGRVMLSSHGQIFVFDMNNEQVPELQRPLILDWATKAEALGFDVAGLKIECCPGGQTITLIKQDDGFNFSIG